MMPSVKIEQNTFDVSGRCPKHIKHQNKQGIAKGIAQYNNP